MKSKAGCDSIITTNLTVWSTASATNNQSICSGGSYVFNGHTYISAGTYKDTLKTSHGCDSVVTTTLTVNPLPTVNLGKDTAINSGQSLTLDAGSGGTYLWSTGESTQTIVVTTKGIYWVRKTNCTSVSDTILVDISISIGEEANLSTSVHIYPNPSMDYIKIDGLKPYIYTISLYDVTGRVVLNTSGDIASKPIDVSMLTRGAYYIGLGE